MAFTLLRAVSSFKNFALVVHRLLRGCSLSCGQGLLLGFGLITTVVSRVAIEAVALSVVGHVGVAAASRRFSTTIPLITMATHAFGIVACVRVRAVCDWSQAVSGNFRSIDHVVDLCIDLGALSLFFLFLIRVF